MKKNIILFIMIVFFSGTANADDQWTSFLTNDPYTDYINAIVTEGNTVWCATSGGVVKWNTLTGTHTVYSFSDPNGNVIEIVSAAIDWTGLKWFGSRGCIYAYDTSWFLFTGDSEVTRNLILNGSVNSIAVDSVNKRVIFKIRKDTIVLFSWDAYDGGKWEKLISIGSDNFWPPLLSIVIDTVNPWSIWGSGGYGSYLFCFGKTDQGYAISNRVDGGGVYVTSLAIDRDNNIWTTSILDAHIALYDRYKNTSTRFTSNITGAIGKPIRVVIGHNGVKWFGTDESLIRYDNESWKVYPYINYINKSEFDDLTALAIDERGDIWMGRGWNGGNYRGYGLYRFHPPATGVDENNILPQSIKILGNHPNPFNPSTTISFSLSFPGKTELAIYSISGQIIRTLISGNQIAGTHSVVWDGRDDSGKAVSSGVYFSRLTIGKQTATGKMLLLR